MLEVVEMLENLNLDSCPQGLAAWLGIQKEPPENLLLQKNYR